MAKILPVYVYTFEMSSEHILPKNPASLNEREFFINKSFSKCNPLIDSKCSPLVDFDFALEC